MPYQAVPREAPNATSANNPFTSSSKSSSLLSTSSLTDIKIRSSVCALFSGGVFIGALILGGISRSLPSNCNTVSECEDLAQREMTLGIVAIVLAVCSLPILLYNCANRRKS